MISEHVQVRQSLRNVNEARQAVETQIEKLLLERKRLRIDRPKWLDVTLVARLDKLRMAAKATVVDRHDLHLILVSLVTKVVNTGCEERPIRYFVHAGRLCLGIGGPRLSGKTGRTAIFPDPGGTGSRMSETGCRPSYSGFPCRS
jgi:hypothetical protein